ncbi:MAG TPA: hypothetical protein VFY25_09740 [Anaerolineales bacterium]|nr:hypothetical protein [Anaerolineales bacterium]
MQKWPYSDFGYINNEHGRFMAQQKDLVQKWEYLVVEVLFLPSSEMVSFFDHYTKEHKSQQNELDAYLEKLRADGWKLATAGNMFDGRAYRFKRAKFRRAVD